MNVNELAVVNLSETRRRSLIVWRAVPNAQLRWKPDEEALSLGDMIRHIWTAQITYHQIVIPGNYCSICAWRGLRDRKSGTDPFRHRKSLSYDRLFVSQHLGDM